MAARTLLSPATSSRIGRYPKHIFQVQELPYTLQPIAIAPVLPGETLENVYLEARAVSDPVKNKLIGWKKEYFLFYVRITDLLQNTIRDMFVDETNTDLTATLGIGSANQGTYEAKGSIDYVNRCTQRVCETWFRDEGEAYNNVPLWNSRIPMVQVKDIFWMDSLMDKDAMPEGAALSTATDAGDLERLMNAFEQLRAMGVANMTYEDFLRSYGIAIPNKDENKPELLAHWTDFQYPSNTVNPSGGGVTSALSWVFKDSTRKPKFFKEPGFVVAYSVTRPKVYFAGLAGNLAGFMGRAWDWMPGYLQSMPETSLKQFPTGTGPTGDRLTDLDNVWVDMRDLLLYGDQFQNVTFFPANTSDPVANGSYNMVNLPTGDPINKRYIAQADITAMFVTPASNLVRSDGVLSLSIKGKQVDTTVGNISLM